MGFCFALVFIYIVKGKLYLYGLLSFIAERVITVRVLSTNETLIIGPQK